MDNLLETLGGFNVTPKQNSIHAEHPRFSQYKVKSSGSSQECRRKTILEARKNKRYDLLNHLRRVEEDLSDTSHEDMEAEEVEKRVYQRPERFKDFLMFSEWLVDVPKDFATSYLAVPCPVGKRCLVTTYRGHTRSYNKAGRSVRYFPSLLPGGSIHGAPPGIVMLDCIYSALEKTYYILDLIFWVNSPLLECETEFRFEWLKSRIIEDNPKVTEISTKNPYRFIPLPFTLSSPEGLHSMLVNPMPFNVEVDGILFYHHYSHYTHGQTPLVGWLKPYMLPEILGVPVPQHYAKEMPKQYTDIKSHIVIYNDERKKILEKRKSKHFKRKTNECVEMDDQNESSSTQEGNTSTETKASSDQLDENNTDDMNYQETSTTT